MEIHVPIEGNKSSAQVLEILAKRQADMLDLYSHAKQAHWTVKGPHFHSLHEFFDEIASGVLPFVDELAERLMALGGHAQGTVVASAKETSLPPYPTNLVKEEDHLHQLTQSIATLAKSCKLAIDISENAKDQVTGDLFIEITAKLDMYLWMLNSHSSVYR